MKFHKLGLINRNQKGITLLELVMAMTVSAIITAAITSAIFQVVNGSARTNNHVIAVRQAQSAGFTVSRDAQMAQSVGLTDEAFDNPDGTRFPLTLTWTTWGGEENTITYTLDGNELMRDKNGTQTSVARFIDSTMQDGQALTRCEYDVDTGKLTLTVTATVGNGSQEQSETRVYKITPRPG